MSRHIISGVAAVIEDSHISIMSSTVWVESSDVAEAYRQIQKLTGEDFPNVEVYTHPPDTISEERVAIELQ